uniref:Uncharacterized protein n=1 Tax=Moniliophthora roreri TaxID=221103 RepID=A0A0W0GDP9_MONRR
MEEVYQIINALCANWTVTAPLTAATTIVWSAERLQLAIYLDTAVDNEGLIELRDRILPMALHLLRTIIQTMMTTFTETENSEQDRDRDEPSTAYTVDLGEEGL